MNNKELSADEAAAIWQALNHLQPQIDHLPNLSQGQVISSLLGVWVAQHFGAEHREHLMQWVINGARDMAKMVDAGIVKPQLMKVEGNA